MKRWTKKLPHTSSHSADWVRVIGGGNSPRRLSKKSGRNYGKVDTIRPAAFAVLLPFASGSCSAGFLLPAPPRVRRSKQGRRLGPAVKTHLETAAAFV